MKRFVRSCFLLALVVSAPATAATSVTVGITLGNAPPPPAIVFRGEPRLAVMPHTNLWYYSGPSDYDYFRYGSYYYIYNAGYWYRSTRYRGPFVAIREAYVPTIFYGLHDRGYHWRHGWKNVPPGQARRMERREDRREGRQEHGKRDRGRGHGRDKD
jgi:hypothetical protein